MSLASSDIDWTSVALVVGFVTTVCSNLDRLIRKDGINLELARTENAIVEKSAQGSVGEIESNRLNAASSKAVEYKRIKRIARWTVVLAAAAMIIGLTKNFEDNASQIIEHIDLFRQNEGLARRLKENAYRSERMMADSRKEATNRHDEISANIKVDNAAMRGQILELQSQVREAAEKAAKRSDLLELSSGYQTFRAVKPSEQSAEEKEMEAHAPAIKREVLALAFLTFENAELRDQISVFNSREMTSDGKYSQLVKELAAIRQQYNELKGRLVDMDEFAVHLKSLTSEFASWLVFLKAGTGSMSRERLVQDLIDAIAMAQSTATYSAIPGISRAKREAFMAPADVRMQRM